MELKEIVIKASKIREESWSVNVYGQQYDLNIEDSVVVACGKIPDGKYETLRDADILSYPAYLLLTYAWNDVLEWAEEEQ